MKIDRLIGIITILLQQEKTTLSALADRFEVSRRTISRDLETICQAGIPVVAVPGYQGGISIMDGYRIDHTVLTSAELEVILAGLKGMDSISTGGELQGLMEKFSQGTKTGEVRSPVLSPHIDLASSHKWMLAPKIHMIQNAVRDHKRLSFCYYSQSGEGHRVIEPYQLVYHWSSWYVWGYCMMRQEYRLFKLKRMEDGQITGDVFEPRPGAEFDIKEETLYPGRIEIAALAEPSAKWRLVDEMGAGSFEEQEDKTLLFHGFFTDEDTLVRWILSFGKEIRLLAPDSMCQKLQRLLCEMQEMYRVNC